MFAHANIVVLDAEEAAYRELKGSRRSRESSEIGISKRAAEDSSLGEITFINLTCGTTNTIIQGLLHPEQRISEILIQTS